MVRWVALFWGFVAFFPVGLNYTAFVLLGVTMAWEGGLGERLARLRQTPYWWPAWAFLGWAALALLLGPHYPETASNALHALRIVLTLALALALALRGGVERETTVTRSGRGGGSDAADAARRSHTRRRRVAVVVGRIVRNGESDLGGRLRMFERG